MATVPIFTIQKGINEINFVEKKNHFCKARKYVNFEKKKDDVFSR